MMGDENGRVLTDVPTQERVAVPRPPLDQRTASVLAIALRALAERALVWITLGLVSGAWFYVIVKAPTWERISAAVLFTVLTHVPTWALWRRNR